MTRWLFFPPIFSLALLLLTALFHNRESALHIPAVVWGITIAAYICLCGVSVFYISKRNTTYNIGISLLAQGILLSVMSLQLGALVFSWLGLILFLTGLLIAFFYATQGPISLYDTQPSMKMIEENNETERERMENLLEKLELPICITDSKGIVIGATERFYEAIGKEPGKIEGEIVSDILPIDQEEVVFDSGQWWISQAKEGARYYFSLLPTPNGKPIEQSPLPVVETAPQTISFYDPDTGLYTDEYRKIRGPEEVARAQRYKRSLSGILMELIFDIGSNVNISDQQKDMLFKAFAMKVKESLRSMDCGFLLGRQRIQVLLPETPQGGAKTLMGRIATLPQDVFDDEIRQAIHPKVKAGIFFYNGATKMEYGIFSASLEESFIKSRESAHTGGTTSAAA